jgi:hypothetical protein
MASDMHVGGCEMFVRPLLEVVVVAGWPVTWQWQGPLSLLLVEVLE